DAGFSIKELRVDGGATVNNMLMQFQSDILNTKVIRPQITETTALGAAYLAGIGVGFFNGLHEIQEHWKVEKVFTPNMEESERNRFTGQWKKAINAAVAWSEEI
ncbi:MAG TPA: FGGY-family carbohydrate kinase, partial [Chitinophagaceae bacterium]|nr:FGGY-family carbohydrate kinase [Chitinophagaceae bacterium]